MVLIIYLFIAIFILTFYLIYRHVSYFDAYNVPHIKSIPFIGVLGNTIIGREGIFDIALSLYNKFPKLPFYGMFMFHKPVLLIREPELIKRIFVEDFDSFAQHHAGSDDHDPVGNNVLVSMKGEYWKIMRKKLTPVFSSAKIKLMFPALNRISDEFVQFLEKQSKGCTEEIDAKRMAVYYTTDVVANVAFSLEGNTMKDPNSEFYKIAIHTVDYNLRRALELASNFLLPEVTKFFNFTFFPKKVTEFVIRVLGAVIADREKSGVKRNDLVDTLVEIKHSGLFEHKDHPFTMEMLYAQAAIFFIAGSETGSSTIAFALYELAKNPKVLDRARDEIHKMLVKNKSELTFEAVQHDTPYILQVIQETQRLYPVTPFIDRECTNPDGYSLEPYSKFKIPHKMFILISVIGLQRDPKYFPDPLKFDPDRFSADNINSFEQFAYLPFGAGNRSCLGKRLGMLEMKVALIKILMKFQVEPTENTPKVIKFKKKGIAAQSDVPMMLKLIKDEIVV